MAEVRLKNQPANKITEIKTIVQNAEMQKAPMGKRLFHAFFMVDSPKQITENLLFQVFVPSVKQLFENMFSRGIHMLLNGVDSLTPDSNNSGKSFISYGSFFGSNGMPTKTAAQALQVKKLRDFDMPVIGPTENEPDAEAAAHKVLAQLRELISLRAPNGHATVSELYQSVGRTPEWTHEYYGWYDLSEAKVIPMGGGKFLVAMPEAVMLR